MNDTSVTYCDFKDFTQAFRVYYSYISIFICIFGSITNVLNICVLTSKQMRCPTNMILTGLAVADLLVMLEYIPFVLLFNKNRTYAFHFTYRLAVFVIFHALYTQAFHFISCCLTVVLAVWRYIAVAFPHEFKWCGNRRTAITILLTYLLCPVVCTPLFLSLRISQLSVKVDATEKIVVSKNQGNSTEIRTTTIFATDHVNDVFRLISSYVYGLVIKLIPCILLTVLSCLLIVKLLEAKERIRGLKNPVVSGKEENKGRVRERHLEAEQQADRTTKMLLAVLLLFLMVEFPQAIFGLLNHIVGPVFEKQCYQPLGDLLDVFTLINSAINFVLYCIMSKKFREVFKEIFFSYIPCLSATSKHAWTAAHTLKTYV